MVINDIVCGIFTVLENRKKIFFGPLIFFAVLP